MVVWLWLATVLFVAHALAETPAQLILNSEKVEPTTTFEVRFNEPMVDGTAVGKKADVSPVEIVPPVKGNFVWLSTRSGVFTPEEALPLSTTFRFHLKPKLKNAGGETITGDLDATVESPAFGLKGWFTPAYFSTENAPNNPRFNLLFNADIQPEEAAKFLKFVNKDGQTIAATVEAGDPSKSSQHYFPYYRSDDRTLLTWAERFKERNAPSNPQDRQKDPRPNLISVTAVQPLPIGEGWKLVLSEGLTAKGSGLPLQKTTEMPIGHIVAFTVREVSPLNNGHGGRRLRLEFSKALSKEVTDKNIGQWIKVNPEPKDLSFSISGVYVEISGEFELGIQYDATVAAGFPAVQDFKLAEAFTGGGTFEPIPPSLVLEAYATHQISTGTRHFYLEAVNTPQLRVTAKLFQPESLPDALKAYDEYIAPSEASDEEFHRKLESSKVPGTIVYSREIVGTDKVDEERRIQLNWDDILGQGKTGAVLLTVEQIGDSEHPRPGAQSIIQVTDLGVVWKRSKTDTFAHVFSLATGEPKAGVKLKLVKEDRTPIGEAVTDEKGDARLPSASEARWMLAANGTDLHLVPMDEWTNRLSLYRFRILHHDFEDEGEGEEGEEGNGGGVSEGRQVLLFTERNVYKPGETVYLKGMVRDTRPNQQRIPAAQQAQIKAFDDRDREVFTRDLKLTDFGSFDAQIALPKGTLGTYRAVVTIGKPDAEDSAVATHEFEVQEYTPNAFEIKIGGAKTITGNTALELPINAKYFMGKTLSKAQLTWSLNANDIGFRPDGFDGFTFCDGVDDYRLNRSLDRRSSFSDQGKLDLSDTGSATVATTVQMNRKAPQPRSAELLTEVTDLNQQTVSQAQTLTLHPTDFYLGIHELPDVVSKGDKLPISVVAVKNDGTPVAESVAAKVRVTRIDWQNNRLVTDEDSSETRSEPLFTLVSETDVKTATVQRRGPKWDLASETDSGLVAGEPGLYFLEAIAKDSGGREAQTSMTFYVTGEDQTEWNYRNQFQIELVPDKVEYLSGETAKLLIKTPISGPALVTVERNNVIRSFVTHLKGNAPSVDVPLKGEDAPNIFVSVMILRGANDSPRKFKEPDYRVGFTQLKVTRPESKLKVTVAPEQKGYQPGETVTITAEVRDSLGKTRPNAEVTLYAVDEGVLSLSGYVTPNPFTFFNQAMPLMVTTSLTIPTLLREDPDEKTFDNKGYVIGGGGDMSEAFRKNFITCPYWNANLRTDQDGKVKATFTAPDSLTRYRLVAVVQTMDDAFGSGESAVEISKPVMFEPALPRFANVGDKLNLRGVLHNLTDVAGEVEVKLELDNTASGQGLTKVVSLPARGSLAVDFPVEFTKVGTAKWKWTARFTGGDGKTAFRDAVVSTLKVGYPVNSRREVQLSRIDKPDANLLAKADPSLLEGQGTVQVSLGNTRVLELRESLNQLLHYPYGCVEQTTSSTLPWIVLGDFHNTFPELKKTPAEIKNAVNFGVDRLFSMQTSSGGFGYWPGAREPHFWGTAYAGLGLTLAKRAGYTVPEEPFNNMLKFLGERLRGSANTENRWELSERCMVVYTLAAAGKPEAAYHELLFKKRQLLTDESRALLALAIVEANGPAAMVTDLLQPKKVTVSEDDAFWSSSRESAVRLLAWCRFKPESPAIDPLATELFGRRLGGHWSTTQGNAWALIALSDYLKRVEKPQGDVNGTLAWNDLKETFTLTATDPSRRVEWALGANAVNEPLKLQNPDKKRIYAEVQVESFPRSLTQPRQDSGFAITRSYAKIGDDGTLSELKDPTVGDRVLITLNIDVRKNSRYVAVNDPLPSIFEAVNPVFKSQQTRAGEVVGKNWAGDYQELRDDRALFFADYLFPGSYTIRYLARVRAAGTATAPSAKVEEMYHPERFGTTETMQLTSLPLK